ncbi:hypothetical protein HU200_018511 [Digitaria exilis]|uniref:Uncharacterized protein n=1 Tax=Digitaria exilis TaxID=1010633 RepID=A0A835F488_9POAL|nr:hypothetical protein HU200_018511 [Digitaria exilis]
MAAEQGVVISSLTDHLPHSILLLVPGGTAGDAARTSVLFRRWHHICGGDTATSTPPWLPGMLYTDRLPPGYHHAVQLGPPHRGSSLIVAALRRLWLSLLPAGVAFTALDALTLHDTRPDGRELAGTRVVLELLCASLREGDAIILSIHPLHLAATARWPAPSGDEFAGLLRVATPELQDPSWMTDAWTGSPFDARYFPGSSPWKELARFVLPARESQQGRRCQRQGTTVSPPCGLDWMMKGDGKLKPRLMQRWLELAEEPGKQQQRASDGLPVHASVIHDRTFPTEFFSDSFRKRIAGNTLQRASSIFQLQEQKQLLPQLPAEAEASHYPAIVARGLHNLASGRHARATPSFCVLGG